MAGNVTWYKELENSEWLKVRYVDQQKPARTIAAEIGCDVSTVLRAMRRHGIAIRTHTSKYPHLNDKEWLRHVYVEERKSTHQIARDIGATDGTVRSALIWAGVEISGCCPLEGRTEYPDNRLRLHPQA